MKRSSVIVVNPRRISRAAIDQAAQIVRQGGVVAYPTETVYGLGANALDRRAVRRIFRIKGRPADKPLIVLVRNRRQLRSLVKEIPPQAKALMDRFWPDGLTLILEASGEVPREVLGAGTAIALRLSSSRVAGALLRAAGVPLTAPSANLSGRPPAVSATEVRRELGHRIDLILDGGRASQVIPSTVLDVRQEPARLIRAGRVPAEEIQRVVAIGDAPIGGLSSTATILLVCTGNTCRSAMAQGMLAAMCSSSGLHGIRIWSAGTHAAEGQPASRWARQVARSEDGIDLSGHRAQRLTRALLEESDLILAMALSHARHIQRMGKKYARKTYLLTSYPRTTQGDPEDIEDPISRSQRVYGRVYRRIKKELERIVPVLVTGPQDRKT